jgi:hypothetical protein
MASRTTRQRILGRLLARQAADAHPPAHVAGDKGLGLARLVHQHAAELLAHKFVAHRGAGVAHTDDFGAAQKALRVAAKEQQPATVGSGSGRQPVGPRRVTQPRASSACDSSSSGGSPTWSR